LSRSKRDLIETVFAVLDDQFRLETTRARSLWGVMTRLGSKLLDFDLSIEVNRQLGWAPLAIKRTVPLIVLFVLLEDFPFF
jgi:hypothetical protein